MPFWQNAPLSLSVVRQKKKLTNYWREGSTSTVVPLASASHVLGQNIELRSITLGAPLNDCKIPSNGRECIF
jgi:hypothetical protein